MVAEAGPAQRLHVVTRKEELDASLLRGKVVVVLDVLFATTSILAALAAGAREVIPVPDPESARIAAQRFPPSQVLLAGEQHLAPIPGFLGYSPLMLAAEPLDGKSLVYVTTNGTVALYRAQGASHVYAGSLRNGEALIKHLMESHRDETLLLVCASSAGSFSLEDFYGAGYLVDGLVSRAPGRWSPTDAAIAAQELYRANRASPETLLLRSSLGRTLVSIDMRQDLLYVAQRGVEALIPVLRDGVFGRSENRLYDTAKAAWPAVAPF